MSVKLPDGELKPILRRGRPDRAGAGRPTRSWGRTAPGKSTLAYSIAGHPRYQITRRLGHAGRAGRAVDDGGRARPRRAVSRDAVPGRGARRVAWPTSCVPPRPRIDGEAPKLRTWGGELKGAMERLGMDPAFAQRNVNEGFSGGEKKRHEIVQLELLRPKIAILDETDSGLDIDALRVVSEGVNRVASNGRDGHPADHPLHPDPALRDARLRARLRRRSHRRGGRAGAGGAARGTRGTSVTSPARVRPLWPDSP